MKVRLSRGFLLLMFLHGFCLGTCGVVRWFSWLFTKKSSTLLTLLLSSSQGFRLVIFFLSFYSCILECLVLSSFKEC
ncbi:unnamed protein product [Brassica rapa subsp. narinosa]